MKRLPVILMVLTVALLVTATTHCAPKKNRQPLAVDLGLPSGTLWASCNLGAEKEEACGFYLAWGETAPKDHYFYDNYAYAAPDGSQSTVDIGESICGTQYDAAKALWGGSWRLPTEEEMTELIDLCEWKWDSIGDTDGLRVTGPSGKSIFLPAGGRNGKKEEGEIQCAYWTGSISRQGFGRTASSLDCTWDEENEDTTLQIWGEYKVFGLLVRPVWK